MIRLIRCLFIISLFFVSCKKTNIHNEDNKTKWIKNNAIEVRTISSNDEDFSDLESLKKIIGDTRVVLLGEQSHGGGTTYEAKVRLIKFLHQEMGFEVMAFESGMFDCAKIGQEIDAGKPMDQAV